MNGSAFGPLITPLIPLIGATIHNARRPRPRSAHSTVEIYLLWILVGVAGVGGLFVTISHLAFPDFIAEQIGFPAGNPFQYEVAMANLSYTVLGLLCWRFRGLFWDAAGIGFAVMYLGDATGHVYQLVVNDNTAPYNAGPILYTDFLIPIVIIGLLIARHRTAPKGDADRSDVGVERGQ